MSKNVIEQLLQFHQTDEKQLSYERKIKMIAIYYLFDRVSWKYFYSTLLRRSKNKNRIKIHLLWRLAFFFLFHFFLKTTYLDWNLNKKTEYFQQKQSVCVLTLIICCCITAINGNILYLVCLRLNVFTINFIIFISIVYIYIISQIFMLLLLLLLLQLLMRYYFFFLHFFLCLVIYIFINTLYAYFMRCVFIRFILEHYLYFIFSILFMCTRIFMWFNSLFFFFIIIFVLARECICLCV